MTIPPKAISSCRSRPTAAIDYNASAGAVESAIDAVVGYAGSGTVEFAVSALDGDGLIDSTDSGSVEVSPLAGIGSLVVSGSGGVSFAAELSGVAELADTGRGLKHFEQTSNIDRVLVL